MVVIKRPKPLMIIILVAAILLIGIGCMWIYLSSPVNKKEAREIDVEIASGTSTNEIGNILKDKELIKSKFLFKVYVKVHNVNNLKANTYRFNQGMTLDEIVVALEDGKKYSANIVKLTFKEGQRITDYAEVISNNTNNSYDDVVNTFKDKDYMRELISKYWFLTDSILNNEIYYPLEGYLAPDTYHFSGKDVEVKTIIEKILAESDNVLSKYKDKLGNNIHYYMTMASVVELEGTNTENRKMIVGIFKNRLNGGMNMGSDVTTYYGLQVPMNKDLTTAQFASVNGYNTRSVNMIGKMPVGPICNSSESSIEASVNPTSNNYLFFVADKKGNIFYTRNNVEHDQKVAEIKAKGDWIW